MSSSQPRKRELSPVSDDWRRRVFIRPLGEPLESRCLMTANVADYGAVSSQWFDRIPGVPASLASQVVGPVAGTTGIGGAEFDRSLGNVAEWVVRLTPTATQTAINVFGAAALLAGGGEPIEVVRGLGLPGQLLVRVDASEAEAHEVLASNPHIAAFEPDAYVLAQRLPNDPDFAAMTGLHNVGQFSGTFDADIDAPEAWEETIGAPTVVVGVIDSGIDVAHPDLYLNIWINQGEIPATIAAQLIDTDHDGRISFYDLNDDRNRSFARDLNANSVIDAVDLLADPQWADGIDTDRNAFVDDFFGWNFRAANDEPFAPNDPRDVLGHGTHVAGTVGAQGDNGRGIVGLNWRSSLMALKFLDSSNAGQTSDAVAAINYATMMRRDRGENVRVLNASWGQGGTASSALRAAIEAAGDEEILIVASAGNGNILGQGMDVDRTPFFPASFDLDNVIAVAASGSNDALARFSNFGRDSVDLAAPGIGVLSTLPGGGYGTANGTSMAAPHVAGAAALAWSAIPDASLSEIRAALMDTVEPLADFAGTTATGGRLNVARMLRSTAFAPRAQLIAAGNVSTAGGTENLITVRYLDRVGIDLNSLGDGDLVVTRQWGPHEVLLSTLVADSVVSDSGGRDVTATYRVVAPEGTWDPLDFGRYDISVSSGSVLSVGQRAAQALVIGSFAVKIPDSAIFYVDTVTDTVDSQVGDGVCADSAGNCSLRAAIQEANAAAPAPRSVILDTGAYELTLETVTADPVPFPLPPRCVAGANAFQTTAEDGGDLNVSGQITILGSDANTTVLQGGGHTRLFTVHPNATLRLRRLAVERGAAFHGGAILSSGTLDLDWVSIADNSSHYDGGGITIWGGSAKIVRSEIERNSVYFHGGGLYVCDGADVEITSSTIAENSSSAGSGGALFTVQGGTIELTNTTVSGNVLLGGGAILDGSLAGIASNVAVSGDGRVAAFAFSTPGDDTFHQGILTYDLTTGTTNRISLSEDGLPRAGTSPSLSEDGRFVAFASHEPITYPDGNNQVDIFVHDRLTGTTERISLAADGSSANGASSDPVISADGRFVAFASAATNLIPSAPSSGTQIFVYDRLDHALQKISVAKDGAEGNAISYSPTLSANGRFVAFSSAADNLVEGDVNGTADVFIFDRVEETMELVSAAADGTPGNRPSGDPSISDDGRFVAFTSEANNLVPGDANFWNDVFVVDRVSRIVERITVAMDGTDSDFGGEHPAISADGRFVAFESGSTNLMLEDNKNLEDVFVYDREEATLELISSANEQRPYNQSVESTAMSSDGRHVGYVLSVPAPGPFDPHRASGEVVLFDRVLDSTLTPTATGPIQLESTTVADNRGSSLTGGAVTLHNSLFLRNAPSSGSGRIPFGVESVSLGGNLYERRTNLTIAGTGDILAPEASALLGPLEYHGGATRVHELLAGSPAIDAAMVTSGLALDQRGISRPQDGDGQFGPQPDIGAVERFHATIEGTLFQDLNGDGTRDTNEPGIPGWIVQLTSRNHPPSIPDMEKTSLVDDPATILVSEEGGYSFDGLAPGAFSVSVPALAGWSAVGAPVEMLSVSRDGIQGDRGGDDPSVSADGRFVAFVSASSNLVPDDTNFLEDVFVFDRQSQTIERVSIAGDGSQADGMSNSPAISGDGRYVAFVSMASNLVADDTNFAEDVFIYDRQTREVERVSVAPDGSPADSTSLAPSLSMDGRMVAFVSEAGNLVDGDTNGTTDIFVVDRLTRTVELVSRPANGDSANSWSQMPAISANGQFITFASTASNLVADDTNGQQDVFVYHLQQRALERVSVGANGSQADSWSDLPTISGDGRFVTFRSNAANLTPQSGVGMGIYVFDRGTGEIERVDVAPDGSVGNGFNTEPSLSADGRFVVFQSTATNLVTESPQSITEDVFVVDRVNQVVARISSARDGSPADLASVRPAISADGSVVVFSSFASNLVPGDYGNLDVFARANRLATGGNSRQVDLYAGQRLSLVDFGFIPDAGEIRGRCFRDQITNGVRDEGEFLLPGCVVYLDKNRNLRRDDDEPSVETDLDGVFSFGQLPSLREYWVAVEGIDGETLVQPGGADNGVWTVYLPPGATVPDRDFGFRPTLAVGQFEQASVSGRVLADGGAHLGIPGVEVYLDLNDNGERDFNEPRTISASDDPNTPAVDESGNYSFFNLGNRTYSVRAVENRLRTQTSPVGNRLTPQTFSLAIPGSPLGSPQDVAVGDLNGDSWPDIATAIYDRNSISILLNDGHGGYSSSVLEFPLAPQSRPITMPRGVGPLSLLIGDFNSRGGLDLAVANSLSSNVAILLDFAGGQFAEERYLTVGVLPNSLASGDLDGDGDLDLVVTHELADNAGRVRNLSLLRNNGNGVFSSDPTPPIAGNIPFAAAIADFNGDAKQDLVVANFGTNPTGADLGDVRVLLANGDGTYQSRIACEVGYGPAAIAVADLDGDHLADLAVANFLSDTISVCRGNGDGTFLPTHVLAGGSGPIELVTVDIELDGDLDLIVANGKSRQAGILRSLVSQGHFSFEPLASFGSANFPQATRFSLATADLDRNGMADLVLANSQRNAVDVHWNDGAGGAHRLALTGVESIVVADFEFAPVNAAPTLDAISNPGAVNEDADPITLALSGITAGVGDDQPLRVEASSNNSALIASLAVQYTSLHTTGNLQITLVPNQSGPAIITVTVTDGGLDGDLGTASDNGSTSQSFTLTVNPLNDAPTIDALPLAYLLDRNVTTQSIALSGITPGGGEVQPLSVTASTTNPQWIQNLSLPYSGAATSATLSFTTSGPVGDGSITIVVTDGGLDNNLATAGDNLTLSRAILVVASNSPPSVSLADVTSSLAEDANLSVRRKVADIVITDDGVGGQTLSLSGRDLQQFEIDNGQLFLRAGTILNFEAMSQLLVTVNVDDPAVGVTPDSSANLTVTITDVNEPPSVALANTVASLTENTDLTSRRKVADIQVTDDALGSSTLTLSGADASHFEIANGNELFLRAGTVLNFETQNRYFVQVDVDDPLLGGTPEGTASLTLHVANVNEPPTLALTPTIASLTEDTPVPGRRKVADLVVTDDSLGRPEITLSGADSDQFELFGTELFLRRGANLDFEHLPQGRLAVVVEVDDPQVGSAPDDIATFNLTVTDVNEPPMVTLLNPVASRAEDSDASAAVTVAIIRVSDDALGTALLRLAGSDATQFVIEQNRLQLRAGVTLDFESQTRYAVAVVVDDPTLGTDMDGTAEYQLSVTDVNEAPSDFVLSNARVQEDTDMSSGSVAIGNVIVIDSDRSSATYGYELVNGAGADDNDRFEMTGRTLLLRQGVILNATDKPAFSVRLRVTDGPHVLEQTFAITVTDVNTAPTAIQLLPDVVPELIDTSAGPMVVGSLVAADDNSPSRHVFTFVTGPGDVDNDRFSLAGSVLSLRQGTVVDYEHQPVFQVRLAVFDGMNRLERALTVAVRDVNEPPQLSLAALSESLAEDAVVSTRRLVAHLSMNDDALGTSVVTLAGTDAEAFERVGNGLYLRAGILLDFEAQTRYVAVVEADDPTLGTGPDSRVTLTLQVTDVNEPPTDLGLSASSVVENTETTNDLEVGILSASDPDAGATLAFSLVAGAGDADNGRFAVVGNVLRIVSGTVLDFETQATYSVRAQATDGTNVLARAFTIQVTDLDETPANRSPVAGNDDGGTTDEDTKLTVVAPGVLTNDTDADAGDVLAVSRFDAVSRRGAVVTVAADGAWTYDPSEVAEFQLLSTQESLTDDFSYTVDDGHGGSSTATVMVTVFGKNDWINPRIAEDVNHDGLVTPIDALNVINELNLRGSRALVGLSGEPDKYYDTNGDNFLTPQDALRVINRLNQASGEGPPSEDLSERAVDDEARLAAAWEALSRDDTEDDWLELLAADGSRSVLAARPAVLSRD